MALALQPGVGTSVPHPREHHPQSIPLKAAQTSRSPPSPLGCPQWLHHAQHCSPSFMWWLCWCGNPAPALLCCLLPPQAPPGLDRLNSRKIQRLTQIIFLGMSLERQGHKGNKHKTQPEHPLRKEPPLGWFHHPLPGSLPSRQAPRTHTAESDCTLPELCLHLSILKFLQR